MTALMAQFCKFLEPFEVEMDSVQSTKSNIPMTVIECNIDIFKQRRKVTRTLVTKAASSQLELSAVSIPPQVRAGLERPPPHHHHQQQQHNHHYDDHPYHQP